MTRNSSSSSRVRADVFPAVLTVTSPDGAETRTLEKVRVVVSADSVYVFQDSSTGPQVIFAERMARYTPPPPKKSQTIRSLASTPPEQRGATALTDSGKTLSFHRSQNCGCGSRLRSFDPFAAITQYSSSADTA